jgi:hypothetical protein
MKHILFFLLLAPSLFAQNTTKAEAQQVYEEAKKVYEKIISESK